MTSSRLLSVAFLALLAGCEGLVETPTSSPGPEDQGPPPFEPVAAVMPRLTELQYRNTLVAIFGEPLPATPVQPDTNPYLFFTIGATTTTLSEHGVAKLAENAAAVTDAVFSDPARRDALIGCTPGAVGDACSDGFLRQIGQAIVRRPLTDEEHARWADVAASTAEGDVYRGLRLAVYGMLQTPSFVYRVELGEPDPSDPSRLRYTSFEMAQRLSYLLWNGPPDAELYAAAASGALLREEGIRAQAWRMLDDPRAHAAVQAFFAQYLDLGRLEGIERDPARYPRFTPTLARSMRTEIELLVDDLVFRRDADIRALFSTRRTFVNDELAALYGVEAPDASAIAFVPVELPEDGHRAGILTLGAFLMMNAHQTETSPTARGKYVRERVLCQEVPPPPAAVDFNFDGEQGEMPKTLRERLEQHREDPACASCHAFMDPPGMLFEHFNSIGAYRTEDRGYPVDSSGDLDGIPLENARELSAILEDDPRVPACIVQQLYRHANGRLDERTERAALHALEQAFAASGYRFTDLLVELAASEAFRTLHAPEVSP